MIQLPLQFPDPKNRPETVDFGRESDADILARSVQRIADYASE
jgi:hypothetical protein